MTDQDPADDPYLLTLGQIAAELTQIRVEFQRMNAGRDGRTDERPAFECQHCPETLRGVEAAKQHAVDDHGAPRSDWRLCYQ